MKWQSRFPAAGSTAPLSSLGTVGGHQPHHHLGSACAPRQLCPEDPTAGPYPWVHPMQFSAQCRVTAITTFHWYLSPHPAAWHTIPTQLPLHLEHLGYQMEPAWLCWALGHLLCPGQLSQHKCSTVGCRSHTHCIQVPKEPALCQSATG